jgi:hypothetical protein
VHENGARVTLHLVLDRQEYLAGEAAWVTRSVFNPNTEAVQVFDPWTAAGSGLLKWGTRSADWEIATPDSFSMASVDWDAPTVTLGPGQTIERRSVLSSGDCPQCEEVPGVLAEPPDDEGRYMLDYCYWERTDNCASTEFSIVRPLVRQAASVKLNQVYQEVDEDDPTDVTTYALYAIGLNLESAGRHYIVLGRSTCLKPDVLPGRTGLSRPRCVAPYDRIAEVGADATALQLSADGDDNLTISWQENNTTTSYCLDRARSYVQPCGSAAVRRSRQALIDQR